jgi:hypothetical protein
MQDGSSRQHRKNGSVFSAELTFVLKIHRIPMGSNTVTACYYCSAVVALPIDE